MSDPPVKPTDPPPDEKDTDRAPPPFDPEELEETKPEIDLERIK